MKCYLASVANIFVGAMGFDVIDFRRTVHACVVVHKNFCKYVLVFAFVDICEKNYFGVLSRCPVTLITN